MVLSRAHSDELAPLLLPAHAGQPKFFLRRHLRLARSVRDRRISRPARERAGSTEVEEASEAKLGVLQGLMQDRARFELRLDDGTVLAGRIDPSVNPATFAGLYNQPVRASLRRLTISRGGRRRVAWLLLDAIAP